MDGTEPTCLGLKLVEWINICILIATIAAIIYGPIKAVKVTREIDEERAHRARKLDVFRALMKTRQSQLSPDHVGALNLIVVEFYENKAVTTAYSEYIKHLNSPLPLPNQQERYFEERRDLFVTLLQAIGSSLGYSFDKHDLSRLGYHPMGWQDDENLQRQNAKMLSELLHGKRPLPISHMQSAPQSPFPPPPENNDA